MVSDSIPVMHWLVSQRNEQGGFASTQDTVVGIYALAKLAERITSGDNDVRVVAKYGRGAQTSININRGNTMILQKYEVIRVKTIYRILSTIELNILISY